MKARWQPTVRRSGPPTLIALFATVAATLTFPPRDLRAQSLLIQNARLIDGTGAPPRGPVSILVRDGRISEIAPDIAGAGVSTLDVAGSTVIPGLIDAHVHPMEVPGSGVRGDAPGRLRALRHEQLRSYLACGVTTVLDAATEVAVARELRAWVTSGHTGPTVLTLLARLSPPGEAQEAAALAANLRAAKRLHDAGVPLVIGSDAGNSSLLSQFHGTSTLRELELLADAGVPAADVLAAATRVSAEMLGISADTGTVERGKSGDLVVLASDPLANIRAVRTIRWTVKAGVVHTPEEWMQQP